jgi:hypothetical protein
MAKNLYDLRFGIRRDDGYTSSIWRLWSTSSGDVYLATRTMGRIEKYSFHKSGICRSAFTKEHGTPPAMSDRALFKWIRAKTPPKGRGGASRVAWIAFPTDFLSRSAEENENSIVWISAAATGGATYLEMAYTRESEESVQSAFCENSKCLHSYTPLPGGEAFFVSSYCGNWENADLRSPPGNGSVFPELLFTQDDPSDTGRPIRIRFGPQPNDGDALTLQELGGYRVMPNQAVEPTR